MGFWSRLGDEISSGWDAVSGAAGTAWGGVKTGASWVGDKAVIAGSAVKHVVWDDPIGSAKAVNGFLWYRLTNPFEFNALAGQGILNAVASTAGIVVDAAANGGALVINSISNVPSAVYNTAAGVTNPVMRVVGLEDYQASYLPYVKPVPYIGFYATQGLTSLANKTGIVDAVERRNAMASDNGNIREPLNGYQKTVLFGSQAVAEVPAFMAASAFTAGTGGALYLGAKGTITTGRTIYTAHTASHALRTASMIDNAVTPTFTRAAFTDSFKNGARAGWNWADPRSGTFNRLAEGGGAGISFWATSAEYGYGLEQADKTGAEWFSQQGADASGWTNLENLFADAAAVSQEFSHSMPYSREGSKLAALQREAATDIPSTDKAAVVAGADPEAVSKTDLIPEG